MKLKILIYDAEEGGYWAEIPALRGCVSEGETMNETLTNIKEAALGWLETASARHQPNHTAATFGIRLFAAVGR